MRNILRPVVYLIAAALVWGVSYQHALAKRVVGDDLFKKYPAKVSFEACATRTKAVADEYYREHPEDVLKPGQKEGVAEYLFRAYLRTVKYDSTGCYEWKDPAAARHMHKSLKEYVIGGVLHDVLDHEFRLFKAAEAAGFDPGIASAFRDPYRQGLIRDGIRAGRDNSFHDGSRADRGKRGWGYGQAMDIVAITPHGYDKDERKQLNEAFWLFVDQHPEFGIGRPYGDYDPGHSALIAGEECRFGHNDCERRQRRTVDFSALIKKIDDEHAHRIAAEAAPDRSVSGKKPDVKQAPPHELRKKGTHERRPRHKRRRRRHR